MVTPDFDFEKSLIPSGTRYLLGIDEVGRGPWAGPVTIGAFLLDLKTFSPDEFIKLKVRDSKKLPPADRQKIRNYFQQNNFSFQTFSATSLEIDEQGIAICLSNLIKSALETYGSIFDFCLIDGNPLKQIGVRGDNFSEHSERVTPTTVGGQPEGSEHRKNSSRGHCQFVVKGDALCFSIAAASIVAKVDRDQVMDQFDLEFPIYGFKSHKGYGTTKHLEALKTHGPCKIHRRSYRPIKQLFA